MNASFRVGEAPPGPGPWDTPQRFAAVLYAFPRGLACERCRDCPQAAEQARLLGKSAIDLLRSLAERGGPEISTLYPDHALFGAFIVGFGGFSPTEGHTVTVYCKNTADEYKEAEVGVSSISTPAQPDKPFTIGLAITEIRPYDPDATIDP